MESVYISLHDIVWVFLSLLFYPLYFLINLINQIELLAHDDADGDCEINSQSDYVNGRVSGRGSGHENGHVSGHENGHVSVHENGHVNGHEIFYVNGHESVHVNGHENGHESAHVIERVSVHESVHVNVHESAHVNVHESAHVSELANERESVPQSAPEVDHVNEPWNANVNLHVSVHANEHLNSSQCKYYCVNGHEDYYENEYLNLHGSECASLPVSDGLIEALNAYVDVDQPLSGHVNALYENVNAYHGYS